MLDFFLREILLNKKRNESSCNKRLEWKKITNNLTFDLEFLNQ